ncbi:VOC family protein [Pseudonocardia petroleophila]|uniref:VOC family protein n=1 Tax=Pseudonocardia petroleophila TaxID=37331 RepID=A0A7G7MCH0_9PSEU|nr:VOC family protein [Pseudonocardia petroleophila]QNG50481.1 VOC family protein [Pseudonocardia petroleophila]
MTATPLLRLYHTGIIVDSLDNAMKTWGTALGLDWAPPKTSTAPMECPDGVVGREVRFTYSLQGPHFIEILEQVDPSPYLNLTGGRRVHHLGYYTDDLVQASADLEERGFRRELAGVGENGQIGRAAFHYSPESPGMWIELVSHEIADEIGGWIAEAAAARGIPFVSPFV